MLYSEVWKHRGGACLHKAFRVSDLVQMASESCRCRMVLFCDSVCQRRAWHMHLVAAFTDFGPKAMYCSSLGRSTRSPASRLRQEKWQG